MGGKCTCPCLDLQYEQKVEKMKDDFLSSLLYRSLADSVNLKITSDSYLPERILRGSGSFNHAFRAIVFEKRLAYQLQRDKDETIVKKYSLLADLSKRLISDNNSAIYMNCGGTESILISASCGSFELRGYTSVSRLIAATSELESIFKQYKKHDE
jgi:hypothetical protein